MDLVIRQAVPSDAAALLEYLDAVGGESDNLSFGPGGLGLSAEDEAAFIRAANESPRDMILLAALDGRIVACGSLRGFSRERMAHRGNLGISVLKAYWRRGIAARLLRALIAHAEKKGLTVLELEVRTDNPGAVALYEKLGFEKIGCYRKFFRIGGAYCDAWLMNLYLEEARESP